MSDIDPYGFADKTPAELEARRQEVFRLIRATEGGEEAADIELLKEAAFLTQRLRQKNAGPPKTKAVKPAGAKKGKLSAADLLTQL